MNKLFPNKKIRLAVVAALSAVLFLGTLQGCGNLSRNGGHTASGEPVMATVELSETAASTVPQSLAEAETVTSPSVYAVAQARLISCGDAMCDYALQEACYDSESESFDFSPCFEYMKEIFASGDIVAANLEAILNGRDRPDYASNRYGYVRLFTPDSYVQALAQSGVTVLTTANNHANDAGIEGMHRTIEQLDKYEVVHTGTRSSESEKPYVLHRAAGIDFAIFAGTYEVYASVGKSLNGNDVERGKESLFNSFFPRESCDDFIEELTVNIAEARQSGADVVVYYPHWGSEFVSVNNSRQEYLAQRMCAAGVDLIVGAHPHVVQNVEVITDEATGKSIPCAYSLGSLTTQIRTADVAAACEDGAVLSVIYTKYSDGTVALTDFEIQPVWISLYTQEGKTYYRTVPVSGEMTEACHGIKDEAAAKASYERTMAALGDGYEDCKKLCETACCTSDEVI